ncbi:MAG: nitroreductase family protein [Limnohabitans sp.]|nr:nitroreductase family protein [Limnohabitans sp.]
MRNPEHAIHAMFTQRWSPRSMLAEPMPAETLLSILEAARWAPSAYNAQPWRFVYAHRDTPEWAPLFNALNPMNQSWARHASALVAIASDEAMVLPGKTERTPNRWHSFDAGAAWAHMALQALHSGYVCHAMAGFDPDKLRQAIGAPAEFALECVVAIGKQGPKEALPAELQAREAPNGRHPLSQISYQGRWHT